MNENELLEIVSVFGKKLLTYGAEVYRAEECIQKICRCFGYEDSRVFAIPCTVIVTVCGKDNLPLTASVDIPKRLPNLDRAAEYMNLSRKICRKKMGYSDIKREIDRIERRPVYKESHKLVSYVIVGFCFVIYFGGTLSAAVFGALFGGSVFLLSRAIEKTGQRLFLTNLICSAVIAFLSVSLWRLGLIDSYGTLILSVLMTLAPGMTFTNGMRDFLCGDLLAGLYTTAESFTAAISLAVGAGAVISVYG